MPSASGLRTRVRAELTQEIKEVARRHLARDGAAQLSLRAVARDVGMVSSAVYRYFPSRDELLTALIIDAYDALGQAAEEAEAKVRRSDRHGRWMALCRAVRGWARAHPHEYALLYGTPVPGYAAPEDTIGPATRVPAVMTAILAGVETPPDPAPLPRRVRVDLDRITETLGVDVAPDLMMRGLMAWTQLFGSISFELFGHRHNVTADDDAFFDHEMARMAEFVGVR